MKRLISLGIEKVILNTYTVLNFDLVKKLVDKFGSQSVVFSLDVKKTLTGRRVFIKSGTEKTKYTPN